MTSATGGIPANFHQGSRSEYLAQYVFTLFGAAVLVPRQEDYGLDLYCTLFSERDQHLVWPDAYYSVQVKSKLESWGFPNSRSVTFIIEYPAPVLLCVISKSEGRIRVYQTMARFGAAASAAELPSSLTLVPEGRGSGSAFGAYGYDEETGNYLLGPAILDFKVEDLLDDGKFQQFRSVLRFWVLQDFNNVRRYQMGLHSVWMPMRYTTNEVPTGDLAKIYLAYAPVDAVQKAESTALEVLDWLANVRANNGDYLGSLLAILMLRNRSKDQSLPALAFHKLLTSTRISEATGVNSGDYYASELDRLLAELAAKVEAVAQPTD